MADPEREVVSWKFYRAANPGEQEAIGFTLVMIVARTSLETQKLFEVRDFTRYLYLHGLSVGTTEALVQLVHERVQQLEHKRKGILQK